MKEAQERALHAERPGSHRPDGGRSAHESRNACSQPGLPGNAATLNDRPESLDLVDRIQKAQDDLHHLYEECRGYAAPIALNRSACNVGEVWPSLGQSGNGPRRTYRYPAGAGDDVDLNCTADTFRRGTGLPQPPR